MLTGRERFLRTMEGEPCDRPPLWEEGIRDDVWEAWKEQGCESQEALYERHHFDRRSTLEVKLNPVPDINVDEDADRLVELRKYYRPGLEERFPDDWEDRARQWAARDHPLGITVNRGVFQSLGVGNWATLLDVLLGMTDEPMKVEAVLSEVTELSLWAVETATQRVTPDFAVFGEPIASFHAPVISPYHYRRFAVPCYRRIVEALRNAGVTCIVVQVWGNARVFIPLWLDIGINTLWFSHTRSSYTDYLSLRREYGTDLRLIGGIDAGMLIKDRNAIDEELNTTVPPLLEGGGYLPLLDDRVRPDVPYENYAYYRTQLEKLVLGNGS